MIRTMNVADVNGVDENVVSQNCNNVNPVHTVASPTVIVCKDVIVDKVAAGNPNGSCNGQLPYDTIKNSNNNENNRFQQRQGSTRRLIKVDYSVIKNIEDDDDDEEEYTESKEMANGETPTKMTHQNAMYRTAYDLATQCPSRKSMRRHTMVCTLPSAVNINGSLSTPQSIPVSKNSSPIGEEDSLSCTLPEMSWSRSSLQDELFESKQWRDECLSLTLEEIVHIRSVLTKAELESLPVEGHVKEDVEKRKVCFLCLKTRFSMFGPWGQICKLCKRTVCAKCSSKMRIPTEHFSHVPVVALSPTMVSPAEHEQTMAGAIMNRFNGSSEGDRGGVGSAPASPKMSRISVSPLSNTKMSSSYHDGSSSEPQSFLNFSPKHILSDKIIQMNQTPTRKSKTEKLKGLEMIVCMDCKTMVIQIIKSSRVNNKNNILHALTLDLTPVY